ncbi:MAG: fumarylacetoacetate hydrolase family protein [Candidatus Omnitrophica bacterium]|nr:fumarylacetoacetate hydrolase family protein [Candidatus Omnitrophota bacterium]
MKIIRFKYQKKISWGELRKNDVYCFSMSPFKSINYSGLKLKQVDVQFLAPVNPSKVVCVGLNYRGHARELGMADFSEPVIFLKPQSSVIGPGAVIKYPSSVSRLDYEAELALVIGKTCSAVSEEAALEHIFGYTGLNDVTARCIQSRDGQWTRAKSFDTFCPIGPCIETNLKKITNCRIKLYLNSRLKQDGCTSDFVFAIRYLVSFISRVMTLYPGDIISTGTPQGVGPMQRGDTVEVSIEGIGRLKNTVV